eukprot:CAMPEP_0197297696 /NCGR_PEP_ID=MMETSP0890-20130614/41759_1 /TAXON_ID=44058 ORGANISM="Aureoumbra lagunensis, Strain CCMP1510" /NCGR_SAMPLE_ID=MMETSP0890 /ASSEMBLY_ACC=CAM_ASM_000533 /LENGTH=508 /DNA_ID=CAMNT_0042774995 /DNA_START=172 /DNA_END=1698 /DNA_ORIENTATION=+
MSQTVERLSSSSMNRGSTKRNLEEELEKLTSRPARAIDLFTTSPAQDISEWNPPPASSVRAVTGLSPFQGEGHVINVDEEAPCLDPFAVAAADLEAFNEEIKDELNVSQQNLRTASKLYFNKQSGKRFRPTIIALLSRALPLSSTNVHNAPTKMVTSDIPSLQAKLGQITEMIHVASLIHDDLLDDADTRRGGDAVHIVHNNKIAVMAGDYLLAKASIMLATLGHIKVVETMAQALDALVTGEVMQIKVTQGAAKKSVEDKDERDQLIIKSGGQNSNIIQRMSDAFSLAAKMNAANQEQQNPFSYFQSLRKILDTSQDFSSKSVSTIQAISTDATQINSAAERAEFELYLRKSYYKTASLICDACKSTALLAGYSFDSSIASGCEEFGFHLGLAFQIVDDVLDFAVDSNDLGKPAGADLSLGLATAPILYAVRDYPQLRPLIDRRFKAKGDVTTAYNLVRQSNGLSLAMKLAQFHAQAAVDALCKVTPPSPERDALISIAYLVLTRKK